MKVRVLWDFMREPWACPWGDLLSRCVPLFDADRHALAIVGHRLESRAKGHP
jgi:hypothetical protein